MISIICASNDEKILNECLIKSLDNQIYKNFELIVVDTSKKYFESAAKALNYGASMAKGDYLLFTHHDVIFGENELKNIYEHLNKITDFGIIGVAGKNEDGKVIGNIYNGIPKVLVSSQKIYKHTRVQTIDEVLFIIKNNLFKKYMLNETNNTWHLYAVDYCLNMKKLKYGVYIIPSDIYHKSAGASMNKYYYKELKNICNKYKNEKIIYTTMGNWHTNSFLLFFDIIKVKTLLLLINIKRKIKR